MKYMFTFEDDDHNAFFCDSDNPMSAVILAAKYVGGLDDIMEKALSKCTTLDEALSLYNRVIYSDYYRIALVHMTELLWSRYS